MKPINSARIGPLNSPKIKILRARITTPPSKCITLLLEDTFPILARKRPFFYVLILIANSVNYCQI